MLLVKKVSVSLINYTIIFFVLSFVSLSF